jgi:hypothetical protein
MAASIMANTRLLTAFAVSMLALSACQSGTSSSGSSVSGKSASLQAMEQVAIAAHKCWIASKDPAFKGYSMANELNSYSGNPRILLVPKKDYGGKPLLIVQAHGSSSNVEVFGPLMDQAIGARIGSYIRRWQTGNAGCNAIG